MRGAVFAFALAAAAPATAAECDDANSARTRIDAFVAGSHASGTDSWRHAGAGFEAPAQDCRFRLGFSWESALRFGVTDDSIAVALADADVADGFWRATVRSSPRSSFLPRWAAALEAGRAFKPATGPIAGVVLAGEARAARYPFSDFAQVSASAELYPRGLDMWLTVRAVQPWSDGQALPAGWFARADVQLSDSLRVFALTGTGHEAELARLTEARAVSGGVRAGFKGGFSLTLSLARETRAGRPARTELAVAVGREF